MNEYALMMAAGNREVTVQVDSLAEAIEIAEQENPGRFGVLCGRQVKSRPGEPAYDRTVPQVLRPLLQRRLQAAS